MDYFLFYLLAGAHLDCRIDAHGNIQEFFVEEGDTSFHSPGCKAFVGTEAVVQMQFGELAHGFFVKGLRIDESKMQPFTMICGGSPCQDFSVAGKQKGSMWQCADCGHEYNPLTVHFSRRNKCPKCSSENLDKTRSSLLVEWLRVVRANKPLWGVYENVKNIVGKSFKETFDMFIEELHEYGYNTYYKVLNAKDFGIPQNRERLYLIIVNKDIDNGKFEFPEGFESNTVMYDILEDEENVDTKYYVDSAKEKEALQEMIDSGKLRKDYSNTVRGGRGSLDRHQWDLIQIPDKEQS